MNTDYIEKKILLRASLPKVWRAISDSKEFGDWFGMRFEGSFVAGRSLRGTIAPTIVDAEVAKAQKPYEGLAFEIMVDRVEPERLFSFRWHPYAIDPKIDYSSEPMTLVEFTLVEAVEGVELTVKESGFDSIPIERRAKAFAANEGGWAAQVKLIDGYLRNAA